MSVYALLYRSRAAAPLSDQHAAEIALRSARRNAGVGVTGLLLYTGAARSEPALFVQWLEGGRDAVRATYERICGDDRHVDCEVITEGRSAGLVGRDGRLFPDWGMGYERVGALPVTVEAFLERWIEHGGS